MITPAGNRDILVKADFESGQWIWTRGATKSFDIPLQYDNLVGYGLSLSIQVDLYSWFQNGQTIFRNNTISWIEFDNQGLKLTKNLALESLCRFNVYYKSSSQNPDMQSEEIQYIPWERRPNVPGYFYSPFNLESGWKSKITFCFGHAHSGWVLMAILSTARNEHQIIHLTHVFDPFPDLVAWIIAIAKGTSKTLHIDEEGHYSYLTGRSINAEWFELVVETDCYDESIQIGFVCQKILALVNRRELVKEFYRRFTDFLENEYKNDEWGLIRSENYNNEEIVKAMQYQPPGLDLKPIRNYLEQS
ncbi:MAG: hypothetical protein HQK55_04440 [Deltaproteobacteria bacterium]|nr:hypothetical protein [Deltaproteobacteria bacterium]